MLKETWATQEKEAVYEKEGPQINKNNVKKKNLQLSFSILKRTV